MKKTFLAASALSVFFSLAPEVFAQGFVPLAEIPGLTSREVTSVVNADSLALFFNNLYKYAIGFAAALAVIEIIWGGLEISTKDSVSKNKDGKDRIQNAVFGLVLVLAPALVFSIINPAILNLSLNLPPLQTTTRTATSGGGGGSQTTTTNGVTQTVTGTYLKTATFSATDPSRATQAASDWVAGCSGPVWGGVLANYAARAGAGSCPGGYDASGSCVGGVQTTTVTAMCAYASPSPFTFVDISTGWFGTGISVLRSYSLKPNDAGGSSFASQCAADGGLSCFSKAASFTSVTPCPPRSFTIPQRARNATSGGDCYQATLICVPSVTANTIDRSNSTGLCKAGADLAN